MARKRAPKKATRADGYTAGWFDYKQGNICLSYWEGERKLIEQHPFRNYFYLTDDEYRQIRCRELDSQLLDVKSSDGYVRLYPVGSRNDLRSLVDWMRNKGVEPLEADLPPISRFLTDRPVKFSEDPKVLFFDLETDARLGWSHSEEHRILSVSYWSQDCHPGDTIVARSDDDAGEQELLHRFGEVVANHDVLVAWNGSEYDEPVLKARFKHNRIWPRWQMVNFLDMLELFRHPYFGYGRDTEATGVKLTFALDVVGSALVDMPKLDLVKEMQKRHGMVGSHPAQAVYQAWQKDQVLLKQYNSRDVQIMVRLEQKFGYVDGLKTLSHLCNRFLSDFSLRTGYLNDAYILRKGATTGKRFPTKFHFYGKENPFVDDGKIEGAYVKEPVTGLHKGVCCLDFASLYPNVIRSFNISPETYVGLGAEKPSAIPTCVAGNGAVFRLDEEGVFPSMVSDSMYNRRRFKQRAIELEEQSKEGTAEYRRAKQRSDANKVIGNSGFGILSSPDHRYYSRECGEAVTVTSKQIIQLVIAEAEKRGIKVLYGDTDSVYVLCDRDTALAFAEEMAAVIDAWVSERGGEPGFIRLELDAEYTRIVFVSKKNYAGMKVTGKLDVKGLAYIRTDGCPIRQKMQKEIIDYLMEDADPTVEGAREIVVRWRDLLFGGHADPADLTITKAVNKRPDLYETKQPQVRVAEQMIKDGKEFYVGMKVPYVLIGTEKTAKSSHQVAIHADDFDGNYDAELYWTGPVFPASQLVLDAAFPQVPWKAMLKYQAGNSKQEGLFAAKRADKVTLTLQREDQGKLADIKKALAGHLGEHPLVLDIVIEPKVPHMNELEETTSVITGMKVALTPAMVKAVEQTVGHRCYYGKEEWDDER